MKHLTHCKEEITLSLEKIKSDIDFLVECYTSFFRIEEVFTSESGGKTRLNRQLFNEKSVFIIDRINKVNKIFEENLDLIKNDIKDILEEFNSLKKTDLIELVFDDINFLEILEMDLNNQVVTKSRKKEVIKEIKELLSLKNRLFNYKYYLEMFNTSIFDKLLNALGVEDLINSTVIFEIIDSYGLQFEQLQKLENEIKNFEVDDEKVSSFQFLNPILELHKRRANNFMYASSRYKIFLDYDNDSALKKAIFFNCGYLQNILSNFIEQSCMDLVKQELKKGKIQKIIDVSIKKAKDKIKLVVRNNGFEVKNIYNLFVSDIDNKYILEAKNLAHEMNALIEINTIENEGMEYSLSFKV